MSRRATCGWAVAACASLLVVAGCSGAGSPPRTVTSPADDVPRLVSTNAQPREALEQGGTLRLQVGALGPDFNVWSAGGNNGDVMEALGPVDATGCFVALPDGTPVVNRDFCSSVTEKVVNGVQTITYVLDPRARFNDGTPVDVRTFRNQWRMLNGSDKAVDVVTTEGYDRIARVEQGRDAREVVVTMKEVYEPYTDLFNGFLHPEVDTAQEFNGAFIGHIRPEWRAGPFTVERFDEVKQTLTLVPNPHWWGDRPLLDRIVLTAGSSASSLPAFANGELDSTPAGTAARRQQLAAVPDVDFRQGRRTATCGLLFNTRQPELADVAVRKAVFQAVNRRQLAGITTQGMAHTEPLPGSWLLLPASPYYQDNYPVADADPDGAGRTLEAAGYRRGADGVFAGRNGPVTVRITNFGDDPTFNALAQALQKQVGNAGIHATIDQRPQSGFNQAMDKRDFGLAVMCYGAGPDATTAVSQFYLSDGPGNSTGCGSAAIDAEIGQVAAVVDPARRNGAAMAAEKRWMGTCWALLPLFNGPEVTATNKYLANWGPRTFETIDWSAVGWMKGHRR